MRQKNHIFSFSKTTSFRVASVFLIYMVLIGFMSCGNSSHQNKKNLIVVSIEPLRYFTEQIAGNRFHVTSIVPDGYSPETYRPTPQQLMELSNCKAYIKVGGLGFETTWLQRTCSEQPNLKVIDTSDSLRTESNGMRLNSFDPHTWTSAKNARTIAATICTALCHLDSAGAPIYKKNLRILLSRISLTEGRIHTLLTNLHSRTFITVHPSLTYFAEEYGLTQLCIEKDGKQPTPSDLKNLIRQSRSDNVSVLLIQKQFAKEQAQIIARETKTRIASINPLGYHWDKEMLNIATAISSGK